VCVCVRCFHLSDDQLAPWDDARDVDSSVLRLMCMGPRGARNLSNWVFLHNQFLLVVSNVKRLPAKRFVSISQK
jgi:hypothetical protein